MSIYRLRKLRSIAGLMSLLFLFASLTHAQDQTQNDLKSLFEDPVKVEAAKTTDQRRKLQNAVQAAGGKQFEELVEDGETGFYQARFADLTLQFTIDYVGEVLSIQSEVQVSGRMDESALKKINRWNQELGISRAHIVESGVFDNSPSTTWMLTDDRKVGFDTPPDAINAFVLEFLKTAKLFRMYAKETRKEPATLEEIAGGQREFLVKFTSETGTDSIEFPGRTDSWVESLGTPQGEVSEYYYQYRDLNRGMLFSAIYYDCPGDIVDKIGREKVIKLVSQQIANEYEADIHKRNELSSRLAVGTEFVLRRDSDTEFAKVRVYMVKNRLYRFLVTGRKTIQSAKADKFLESFRIGNKR